jgi:hypothetical protein
MPSFGVAALGREAVNRIVQSVAVFDDFITPTIPIKSTTLVRSKSRVRRSFSKLIILTRTWSCARRIRLIRRSPGA